MQLYAKTTSLPSHTHVYRCKLG